MTCERVCDRLKKALRELHVHQVEVARRAGKHEASVSRQLAGHAALDPDVEEAAETLIREARANRYLRVGNELTQLAADILQHD